MTYDELIEQAKQAFKEKEYCKVIGFATQAVGLDSTRTDGYYWRGRAVYAMGLEGKRVQFGVANSDAKALLKLPAVSARDYAYRGWAHFHRGICHIPHDCDAAIADCSKAIRKDGNLVEAYLYRGDAYACRAGRGDTLKERKRNNDAAIRNYDKAITLDSCNAEIYLNRGDAYAGKESYNIAIQDYDKAIELDSGIAFAYIRRGNAYAHNDHDTAMRNYDKAIEIAPMCASPFLHRGRMYARKGELDAAIREYDKAIERDSEFVNAYIARSMAYGRKGDHDASVRDDAMADEIFNRNSAERKAKQ